jgi:hypothetical protein
MKMSRAKLLHPSPQLLIVDRGERQNLKVHEARFDQKDDPWVSSAVRFIEGVRIMRLYLTGYLVLYAERMLILFADLRVIRTAKRAIRTISQPWS